MLTNLAKVNGLVSVVVVSAPTPPPSRALFAKFGGV